MAREFLQQALMVIVGQGLKLLFVFDGDPTLAKSSTDQQRQKRRQEAYSRVVFGEGTYLKANMDQNMRPKVAIRVRIPNFYIQKLIRVLLALLPFLECGQD